MEKLKQKSKERNSTSQATDKRKYILGSIMAIAIASSPYLFYLHESVPRTQTWSTFLFEYNSRAWGDANLAMWILTGKALPLLFLIIWFFTNRHWWYHALLVPISMYIFQIFSFFNEELDYLDEFQLIYLVPIMCIIIPSIYLIRAQIFNKINYADKTMEEIEAEFMLKPTTLWGKIKQYF